MKKEVKETTTKETKNEIAVKENTKAVVVKTSQFATLFDALVKAETKAGLVKAMTEAGWSCKTKPTTTPNKGDLYIQLTDGSRLQFKEKTINFYTNEDIANKFTDLEFKPVNDGKYRTKRAIVTKTQEMFDRIFGWFTSEGIELHA